jgi:uncharacterized alkaline shock family protein YloU
MTKPGIAQQLVGIVESIDGVINVYDARPTALAAAADLVATVIGQPAGEPIAVTSSAEGLSVDVSVAIDDSHPAPEVSRRIFDAVSGFLEAESAGETVQSVKIQVSSISCDSDAD